MSHNTVVAAPTLQALLRRLQEAAASQASVRARDLYEVPGAWPSVREATERLAGLEIAEAVLRDRDLLTSSTNKAYRLALGVLNTAAIAVTMLGRVREADALQDARRALGSAIETHYAA